jgi:AGCS family alanine or glycine:cation symporter
MLMTAAVGMCTKFVEVTLSHKYREKAEDGSMAGGPMYYMKNKLNMKWLAGIFAFATILSSFGTGSLPQINSISASLNATFGLDEMLVGAVLAILLGLVILGGIKRIAAVTSRLVPGMALIYLIGALSVIIYNYENIIPSLTSIFSDLLSGSAATGGFLGASIAFAFNKGVGRGLFSNEAGQGSAPIAHAAAKANQPVSEGLVAILEPFIDTILICTLTALVLLSSGVWTEKLNNTFDYVDMEILANTYSDKTERGRAALANHINGTNPLEVFDGELDVIDGVIQNTVSIINARSLAEDVVVMRDAKPINGSINITEGKPKDVTLEFTGRSLVHSAPLTAEAFTRSYFGHYGQYIVSIGLLLFAFSTAISWSYYGGRAMTYLLGSKSVKYYRIVYVIAFFIASFADTTVIWTLSGITIALMTLPNLFGILMLRKDMKSTVADYWVKFKKDFPEESTPE